jgi:long-chain acyl-CoA synthetase
VSKREASEPACRIDLGARIGAVLGLEPDAPAIEQDGCWHTWGELSAVAGAVDDCLTEAGHGPGSAVAVVLRNCWSVAAAVLGLLSTRRCVVVVSPIQTDDGLRADLRSLRPSVVLAAEGDWDGPGLAGVEGLGLAVGAEAAAVRMVRQSPAAAQTRPGVAIDMLTSGTTGRPKRVAQSYAALESALQSVRAYTSRGPSVEDGDRPQLSSAVSIIALPLSHMSGLWPLIQAVAEGRRVSLLERFEPFAWAELVRTHRPVSAGLPPAPMRMVLEAKVPREWLASLKAVRVGSAHLPPELGAAFEETYGIPALPIYGATEFAGSVAGLSLRDWRDFGATKRGTVGRAQPGVDVRVVDPETGVSVAPGERGLLEVRIAAEGTGWQRTTDLARLDEDGFLFIDGRSDDAVIRGGFKVLPPDVEAALESHPAVAEAVVVGVADERLGSVPVAAVVAAPDQQTSGDELVQWCRDHLRPYQVPVAIHVLEALPQTRSMKVDRGAVRDLLTAGKERTSP